MQIYLYRVRNGQAFQGRADCIITAQDHKQSHQQGHRTSHEVQPERQPTCAGVKQQIVIGVDVIQGLEPNILIKHRTNALNIM